MNADNIIPNVFQKFVYKIKKFWNTLYVSLLSRQEAYWTDVCEPTFEGSFFPAPNIIRTLRVSWKPQFVKQVIGRDPEVIFLWQVEQFLRL